MKGLKPQEIRNFLQASYEKDAPMNIDGYVLDEKLSNLYGKVYVNEDSKKVILGFRGTGMENLGTDWINNLIFAVSDPAYKLTPRYRTALKMYKDAMNKYPNYQFDLLGHSQSGIIVNNLCNQKVRNCISLNPAYKNASLKNNEYIIRSKGDVVSKLTEPKKLINSVLYPKWSKNHMITIDDKTGNPITEHKVDILDRLNPNMVIGRGNQVNPWVEHVRKYAKANNITYMCAITEASKTYKKDDKLKSTLKKTPKAEPKALPKAEPKASPKALPKTDYRISVINKKNDNSFFDFNYSRDFKYKTMKNDLGYDFIFNNINDYNTAKDVTMFNMNYKNPRLYKWIYHNDMFQPKAEPKALPKAEPKASPKASPKAEPKASPKAEPKASPKASPKAKDDFEDIANEWNTNSINYVLDESKTGNDMRNVIEKLVRNKKVVLPPDLFFSNDAKMLLEELLYIYSIQEIDEVIVDYINYIDEDAKLPTHKDYFPQYQKRIKTPTLNRISKSSTFLGRKQTQELGMDRLNMLIGKGLGKSNPWVEHVKKYAKANNITYMCAITEASKTYKK